METEDYKESSSVRSATGCLPASAALGGTSLGATDASAGPEVWSDDTGKRVGAVPCDHTTTQHRRHSSFWHRAAELLEELSRNTGCFFLSLCALRVLARPYAGLVHDASLYAMQTMNRVTSGFFAQDLFFLYGSQDEYSLFSVLMAPLAATLGLSVSFFLAHFASTALVVYAEMRLVRCLIPDRLPANLALLLLAVSDLPYAGYNALHVHESFLTGRVPATGLVLLALEQSLRNRPGRALLLTLLAGVLHPLMALGGFCIVVGAAVVPRLSARAMVIVGVTLLIAAAAVLGYRPLGTRLFGYVDPAWYDFVQRRTPVGLPLEWSAADWCRILFSLAVVMVAGRGLHGRSRLTVHLVVLLAAGGLAVSVAGEVGHYALLLQGQAYRGLWLLQWFVVPLGVFWAVQCWRAGSNSMRLAAVVVLCGVGRLIPFDSFALQRWGLALIVWGGLFAVLAVTWWSRRASPPTRPATDWFGPAALASAVGYAAFMSLSLVGLCIRAVLGGAEAPLLLWGGVLRQSSGAVVASVGVLLMLAVWRITGTRRVYALAMAGLWVVAGVATYALGNHPAYRDAFVRDHNQVTFVRSVIQKQTGAADRPNVVYWPTDGNHIWFGLPAVSYFSWKQSAGAIFNRETALETKRRCTLVKPFEIAAMRWAHPSSEYFRRELAFFQTDLNAPAPTKQDLATLCREQTLDFIVLRDEFDGLYAATNGEVFVYDCRSLRATLSVPTNLAIVGRNLARSIGLVR